MAIVPQFPNIQSEDYNTNTKPVWEKETERFSYLKRKECFKL